MRVRDKELIKELRLDKGITQNQLAALANCSQSTISAIENGHMATISVDLGEHLSRWLDRRPRELFDEFDDEEFSALRVKNVARNNRQRRSQTAA